jgi:endonuclease YncB( thermonuclease family)
MRMRKSKRLPAWTRWRNKLIACLIFLLLGVSGGAVLPGRVISVADGDTLTALGEGGERLKIRLYGIDSPELQQAGGKEARAFTSSLAQFSKISLQVQETDQYGRTVAIVTLPDGRVLNEELLTQGQAWLYPAYCNIPRCIHWQSLEAKARREKKGLWGGKKPVPPWQWRRRHTK